LSGLLGWLARRVSLGALTVFGVACVTYLLPRALRPERQYSHGPVVGGTLHDVGRGFLHFDWGVACGWPGCPSVRSMFARGFAADLWLIGGALVIGVGAGMLGARWCARRPRSRRARGAEAVASLLYCTPVYVIGYATLILFNPTFGAFPIPAFFGAAPAWAQPWTHPWEWFETLAVPCLVLAAPLAAMCMRLGTAVMREEAGADYVRTAYAKGLSPRRVMSRHVAPVAHTATASFVGVSIPIIVLNLVLVETVFSVPGFFVNTWRALGHVITSCDSCAVPDIPMLQAISVWAALLIVVLGIAVDAVLGRLDPRIRHAGPPG
jgi:peptide/nickel transport system permease protein